MGSSGASPGMALRSKGISPLAFDFLSLALPAGVAGIDFECGGLEVGGGLSSLELIINCSLDSDTPKLLKGSSDSGRSRGFGG